MATKKVLLKVIILGESGVGKTALLHKYVSQQFIEHHKATIGADFMTKEIKIDDKLITLQMWDTAGQERFKSLGNSFYRGADAAIIVYDLTDKASFDKVNEWRDSFLRLAGENADEFPILLLGNKHDLADEKRAVSADEGMAKANDQMLFFETSAMNGKNIEAAIKKLSDTACARNTAPIFSADVIKSLELPKDDETPDAGCACLLL